METLNFSIDIDAAPGKVWEKLWNRESYSAWTAPFTEGSYMEGELVQGGKVQFMAPGGKGMYSTIEKMVPNETIVFKHQGEIKDGQEQPVDEKTKQWSGALESYQLIPSGNGTTVKASVDANDDFKDYLQKKFPLALNELKRISEE